jgi:quaternary ammonium compound-resistance protein SugE
MEWIYLMIASFFEVIFAIFLKYSNGYSKLVPSLITTIFAIASVVCLSKSLHRIPLGVAYSIWTGFGVLGSNLLGVALFGESLDFQRILFLGMIFAGILGLYWR